jgi:hypothetical protein
MTLPVSGFVGCNADNDADITGRTVTTDDRATTMTGTLAHPVILLKWRDGDESKTTISTGGGAYSTASPASSHTGAPIRTTTPGAGARVAAGGVLAFVLAGASVVASLLM